MSHGAYRLEFFVHGIRHMHKDVLSWCDDLEVGGRLLPLLDVQNPADVRAVALRGDNNTILVGYVPGFYALNVRKLLIDESVCPHVRITVVRNNSGAPLQLRLLCRVEAPLPDGFDALPSEAQSVARKPEKAALA
jgi:hypothetical protein